MSRPKYTSITRNNRTYKVRYGDTAHLRYLSEQNQDLGADFRRLPNGRVVKSKAFLDDLRTERVREYENRRLAELRENQRLRLQRREESRRLEELRRQQSERHLRQEMNRLLFGEVSINQSRPARVRQGREFSRMYDRIRRLDARRQQIRNNDAVYRLITAIDADEIVNGTRFSTIETVFAVLMIARNKILRLSSNQAGHYHIRVLFKTVDDRIISFGLNNPQSMTLGEIKAQWNAWLEKYEYVEPEPFEYYISVVENPNAGGCDEANTHSFVFNDFYPRCRIWMISPKAKNNNCLINCFNTALNLKGNKSLSSQIRKHLGYKPNTPIDWQDVHKVAEYHRVNLELYCHPLANENDIKERYVYAEDAPTVRIHLINGHYVLESKRSSLFCCIECGAGMKIDPKTGKRRMCKGDEGQTTCDQCNPVQKNFYQRRKKMMKILAKKSRKAQCQIQLDKLVFFDLETFQSPDKDYSEAYSVGFMRGSDSQPNIFYGKDCMSKFMDFVKSCEGTVFIAFNGARFDHYFLVNRLLKDQVEIATYKNGQKKVVVSNGRVLQFEFGNNNKVWDLCLFLQSSLEKSGKAFGCDVAKGDFDHELVKSWEDTETHREEITSYLEKDVLLLKELHLKYADEVYQTEGLEVTNFLTMPQMSFLAWNLTLTSKAYDIFMNYSLQEYVAFRDSRYGGRCYPMKHRWESKNREVDWQKLYDSDYFYVAVDIVSQYPAVMRGCKMLKTSYPVGQHRESENPKQDFEEGKFGVYFIKYTPNRNISVPILPRRNHGLDWDLNEGSGWYTNIDILNAIEFGQYTIEFTGRAFVWDQITDDLFAEYIDRYFEMKKEASASGNKVKRLYSKISMNSLYGKLQQRPFDTVQCWSNDNKEIQDFLNGNILDDLHLFEDANMWLVTAKKTDISLVESITKPLHIGAFILSYSRRLYLQYLRIIDPTLTRPDLFIYTDTDSFFVSGKDYKTLKAAGVFGDEIGMLSNDIDNDGLITHFISYAPKTYYGLAVNNKNQIVTKAGLKGIPNKDKKAPGEWIELPRYSEHEPHRVQLEDGGEVDLINYFDFLAGEPKDVSFTSFQKIHTKANKQEPFSINVHKTSRTAFKSIWTGMDFNGDTWTPKGYQKI